jgi:maleate isomerase
MAVGAVRAEAAKAPARHDAPLAVDTTGGSYPTPTINVGWRMRLGVIAPSVNTLAEPQFQAMLPDGVSLHTTRLKLVGSSPEELLAMTEGVEEASLLLKDTDPHLIMFHCTAITTFDAGMPQRLRDRITKATGIPSCVTSDGIVAAFEALGARKTVMVTPYLRATNEREVAFLEGRGIKVLREHGLELERGSAFAEVEPTTWYRLVMEHRHPDADAYFISCAQVRSAEVIEALERDLQRPVITSNQAAMWHCLRSGGIRDTVNGFGTLFRM